MAERTTDAEALAGDDELEPKLAAMQSLDDARRADQLGRG